MYVCVFVFGVYVHASSLLFKRSQFVAVAGVCVCVCVWGGGGGRVKEGAAAAVAVAASVVCAGAAVGQLRVEW
jgi:heptaprenylglyceryl phosphate synthase